MKKITCLALTLSMIISLIFASGALAFLKGDVNGDREVNNKDVVVLFRYVSGTSKVEDETVYDFNGDGDVNNKDVVALFRYVSSGEADNPQEQYEATPDEYFEFTLLDNDTYEIKAKIKTICRKTSSFRKNMTESP